ncbi:hypothetical protein ACVWZV_002243 [Bradyrhizobium sp. GM5.1]
MQWRLRGLFNKTFVKKMLSAQKTRFDIGKAMDRGKIVVIDNSQAKCTPEGCGFIGRLFVSLIWSAGTARHLLPDHLKKPTFVYIDEAHQVIKKDQKIAAIIDELRSAKVGLILAHQRVQQIEDPNVRSALEACAIKMANVDAEAPYFSKLLRVPEERMDNLRKGQFAMHIRGEGGSIVQVPIATLPFPTMNASEKSAHRQYLQKLYGVEEKQKPPVEITTQTAPERAVSVRETGILPASEKKGEAEAISAEADKAIVPPVEPLRPWKRR